MASTRLAISLRPTPRRASPYATFSPTLIIGNRARCWNTMLTGRRLGATPRIERPPMRTSPSSGARKPAIILNSVVLPQPDGPRIEKKLPCATASDSASTATCSPKRFVTRSTSRSGGAEVTRAPGAGGACASPAFAFMAPPRASARLHPVEYLAFDVLDSRRNRRIPLDVLQRGFGEALRELRFELRVHQLVGALGRREISGGSGDLRRDLRPHVEVDPRVRGRIVASFRRQRERVDPAERTRLRRDVLDIGILAVELPAAGVPHHRADDLAVARAVQQLVLVVPVELDVTLACGERLADIVHQ